MYRPNRDTHVPTNILSQNTDIFLQLNIDKYVPTQQIHTRTLRLLHVKTIEHRHILRTAHKLLCTNPVNTHICTNQNTDLFIQLNIDSYVQTKQRHTHTNNSFD